MLMTRSAHKRIIIRPFRHTRTNEFAEYILDDLISQGYEGQRLLARFREISQAIRPAVQKMIKDADALAESGEGRVSVDELFGKAE
ncbi:MAG: hypothetical protein LBE35_08425 [Clostridiales bacterium]|nr:hypothetical protein [Clostridiales bacterium]